MSSIDKLIIEDKYKNEHKGHGHGAGHSHGPKAEIDRLFIKEFKESVSNTAPKDVKLDRPKIMAIAEKLAIKKFGNVHNESRNKYKEKIVKFIKTEQFTYDIDAVSAMEVLIFGEIMGDFR